MQTTTVGLDLAKSVFQVHCLDSARGIIRKKLRRSEVLGFFKSLEPCLVGMESRATAHHWAREISALGHGGAADAASLCESLSAPAEERCRRR